MGRQPRVDTECQRTLGCKVKGRVERMGVGMGLSEVVCEKG